MHSVGIGLITYFRGAQSLDYPMEIVISTFYFINYSFFYFLQKAVMVLVVFSCYLIFSNLAEFQAWILIFVICALILLLARQMKSFLIRFNQFQQFNQVQMQQENKMQLLSSLLPRHVSQHLL